MVQGPLFLREARAGQRQGRQVGRRDIEALRELDTGCEFRWKLELIDFVEHDRYLRTIRSVKELILLAA